MTEHWIEWGGGKCPVAPDVQVKLQFESETREEAEASPVDRAGAYSSRAWRWQAGCERIIAYRIAQ